MPGQIQNLPDALPLSSSDLLEIAQPVGPVAYRSAKVLAAAIAGLVASGSFIASGAGATTRTMVDKARDFISVKDFGATGNGVTNDTAAIQLALNVGGTILFPAGTYIVTTINCTVANTSLWLTAGATISLQNAVVNGVNITALNCSIYGPGRILSPASWSGTNSRRTYATVWVAADGFMASGLTLDNIPRCGIHFEDCTNARIENCRLIGNFPQADYIASGSTLTGHAAIDYNPPPTATTANTSLVVIGNRIEKCVQGVLIGNYDAAATEAGISVTGNSFNLCWDHGIYLTLCDAASVVGNTFHNCKVPIVVDVTAPVITGNSLFATEVTLSNREQIISVRDCNNGVISNNTIYGFGAAILLDSVSSVTQSGNVIANNTIISTGAGLAASAIRVGFNAEICESNRITGNVIKGGDYGEFVGAIQVEMKTGFVGQNNVVSGNTVDVSNVCNNIAVSLNNNAIVRDNQVSSVATAASAKTTQLIYMATSTNSDVSDNTLRFLSGGTNINARGIQFDVATGNKAANNRFFMTAGGLTSSSPLGSATAAYLSGNQPSPAAFLNGLTTIAAGTASINVVNANVLAGSTVVVVPANANAGALVQTKGFYVTVAAGSFTIFTGDGTNAGANSDFRYLID